MSFEEDFDEELEPVKSKTPSSKVPSTGKKVTLYLCLPLVLVKRKRNLL